MDTRLDPAIRKALDETGLPWEIEQGGAHRKLRVGGKFAAILRSSGSSPNRRTIKNTIAQIRRAARDQ